MQLIQNLRDLLLPPRPLCDLFRHADTSLFTLGRFHVEVLIQVRYQFFADRFQ